MDALAQSLAHTPELFPHTLDLRTDSVGFIRLREGDFRAASFLDERILAAETFRRAIPWDELDRAVASSSLAERCNFIFHIGHAGSTLLSRLIGGQPDVLALREPSILRTLVQIRGEPGFEPQIWGGERFEKRLSTLLKLWSRTFHQGDLAVLKASSFVSEMASDLMRRPNQPRSILMTVSPESYLATILGGANAPQETKALGPMRLKRLRDRLGDGIGELAALSMGETVAMSWACEMTALCNAKAAAEDRAMLLNFDAFLLQPHALLARCFDHLGLAATAADVQAALSGPDMRRYSKAPEYAYDANLRRDVLNQARAISGDEIRRGLSWLDHLALKHPAVATAITLST
jgi:hypothetical protein